MTYIKYQCLCSKFRVERQTKTATFCSIYYRNVATHTLNVIHPNVLKVFCFSTHKKLRVCILTGRAWLIFVSKNRKKSEIWNHKRQVSFEKIRKFSVYCFHMSAEHRRRFCPDSCQIRWYITHIRRFLKFSDDTLKSLLCLSLVNKSKYLQTENITRLFVLLVLRSFGTLPVCFFPIQTFKSKSRCGLGFNALVIASLKNS